MLDRLRLARYRFVLAPIEPVSLPPYKGAALRGAFGHAFKRMTCQLPGSDCANCQFRTGCAYSYVFATPTPADAEVLRTHSAVPRPFVIEPPLDGRTQYEPCDDLPFGLVLVGRGIEYLPFFVLAFKMLGEEGLGRTRGRFRLKAVWAQDPLGPWETLVYDGPSDALRNVDMTAGIAEIEQSAAMLPTEELLVRFLTPTALKHNGRIVPEPAFHVLVRGLLRRISSLYYFHCGERWAADYKRLVEQAQAVDTVESNFSWQSWERFSGKQRQRIRFGGIVGRVRYGGPLADFHTLLILGSVVHVGKGCVFGNGQYRVEGLLAND